MTFASAIRRALAAFGLVFPILTFRWSRALWLGIEHDVRGRTREPGSG